MPQSQQRILRLGIGGVILGIIYDDYITEIKMDDAHKDFIVDDTPDVVLWVYPDQFPDFRRREAVFDSGGRWRLDRIGNGQLLLTHCISPLDAGSRLLIVMEPDFRSGSIYLESIPPALEFVQHLLPFPLGEVLLVNMLSQGLGSLFHACGVIDRGRGILFAGTSGAGKSTLAKLWRGRKDVTVLNDDRIVVRKDGDRFWMYGTPWYGEVKVYSSQRAPLERIFVIKHAARNTCTKLHRMGATSALMVRSFSPFWDKSGMEFALRFCAELSESIPCYELGFVPDDGVFDFVRSVCDER
jgi:hypothetical protein